MLKYALLALCIASSATADVGASSDISNIIKIFMKKNKKAQSIAHFLRANKSIRNSDVLSKMIRLDISTEKILNEEDNLSKSDDNEFSPLELSGKLELGLNSPLDVRIAHLKYKKSLYSKDDPSIYEFDEITLNYLKLRAQYTQKLHLLAVTEKYIQERRNDIKEYEVRARFNDASSDELAEGKASLAESEATYKKLQNDVNLLYTELQYQLPNENGSEDVKSYETLDLAQLESFVTGAKINKPNSSIKAELSLKLAASVRMQSLADFSPKIVFGLKHYFNRTSSEEKIGRYAHKVTLGVTMNLAPSRFFDALTASRRYEAAINDFEYDQSKTKYEFNKNLFDMQNARDSAKAAELTMISRKETLNSAVLHYKGGTIPYAKLAQARADYQKAAERYCDANERYIDKLLEFLKITGTLREMFLLEHNDL